MNEYAEVILYTFIAGLMIPLGGLFAWKEHIPQRWLRLEVEHGIVAFGGGVLLAAVALVLVPGGIEELALLPVAGFFSLGALVFLFLDRLIQKHGGSAAQVMAMTLDFTPEAIALGAAAGTGNSIVPLLALLIGLQNLPEGFNSYRDLIKSELKPKRWLLLLTALAFLGPISGSIGLTWLTDEPEAIASIMLFAAGGILYLTFQDIAPQAKLKRHWAPSLGAVAGFLIGVIGEMTIGP